jgi:creatinine amidohydrolase
MTPHGVHRLAALTYPQVQALLPHDPVVLVAIGSTEAHGPHLPLETDSIIAQETAARAAARIAAELHRPAILAPGLPYGVTDFAKNFAGTVSLPADTVTAIVRDIALGLAHTGFRTVVFINHHLEPAHVDAIHAGVQAAHDGLPTLQVLFANHLERRHARTLTDEFRSGACHAGQYETSLVLAAAPGAVDQATAQHLPPNPTSLSRAIHQGAHTFEEAGGPDAYFGWPAQATADEGHKTYALLADIVLTTLQEAQ